MRILLVSDSHGNNEALQKLIKMYPNMDLYLHLGDSESDPELLRPFITVKGNCDYFSDAPESLLLYTEVGYIFATHRPPIINNRFILENNIAIVCNGHTHKRKFEKVGNIIYINPGALSYSRDGHDLSYSLIKIENGKVENTFEYIR